MSAVLQAFRVLNQLARSQPVGVSELARILDMPKTTTHRILKDLERAGWTAQRSGALKHLWVLTAAPAVLSQYVARDSNLREAALPVMEALREQWRESVHLAVPEGRETVIILELDALHAVRIHWPVGQHYSTHATANGRTLVAFSSGAQRDLLYPREFTKFTDRTITSKEVFDEQLEIVRRQGYAIVKGELRDDVCSIAAPILNSGSPVASVSVFSPTYRFQEDRAAEIANSVAAGAQTISSALTL